MNWQALLMQLISWLTDPNSPGANPQIDWWHFGILMFVSSVVMVAGEYFGAKIWSKWQAEKKVTQQQRNLAKIESEKNERLDAVERWHRYRKEYGI